MWQLSNGVLVSGRQSFLIGDERLFRWGKLDADKCRQLINDWMYLFSNEARKEVTEKAADKARQRLKQAVESGQVPVVLSRVFEFEFIPTTYVPDAGIMHDLFNKFFNEEYQKIFSEKFEAIENEGRTMEQTNGAIEWSNRMEQTATLLERVISDVSDYANHYGKYTDFVDDTIRFKWDAKPLVKKLREMAKYAKENKLEVGTYIS